MRSLYETDSYSGMSNLTDELVKGSLRVIASSREAEMESIMKMQRYIRLDLVWFFLLESSRMRMPTTNLLWKSSRIVKSSKTC